MRKILLSWGIAFAAFTLTACSDDTGNPYAHTSTLEVVSSNVTFPSEPATGKVVFTSNAGGIRVRLNSSWAKATVVDDTVKVDVTRNDEPSDRYAKMTVFNGTDSVNVSILQKGFIFRINAQDINAGDDAQQFHFTYKTTNPKLLQEVIPTVKSTEDWISATLSTDGLNISLAENNTGHLRTGAIQYTLLGKTNTIKVTQADFDKDLAGKWYMVSSTMKKPLTVTFKREGNRYSLVLDNLRGWTIPVKYYKTDNSVVMSCGDTIGTYKNYLVTTVFLDTTPAYWTWEKGVTISAKAEYSAEDKATSIAFEDDGKFAYGPVGNLWLYGFLEDPSKEGARPQTLLFRIGMPTLIKFDE